MISGKVIEEEGIAESVITTDSARFLGSQRDWHVWRDGNAGPAHQRQVKSVGKMPPKSKPIEWLKEAVKEEHKNKKV